MLKVYAVVVTYNGQEWLDRCLGSLSQSKLQVHILVVDNASIDGTPDYIEQHFPEIELVRSTKNLGFGRGNNIGLKKALAQGAEYVFLLNQDAWIEPDTLEKLIQVQKENPQYGILSPVHLEGSGDKLEYHFSTYVSPGYCRSFSSDAYLGQLKNLYETRFVNAACWLMDSEVLKVTGVFDPLFSHYGEDEDLVNRLKFFNFKIGVVPQAIVYHDISYKSWEQLFWNKERQKIFAFIQLKDINTTLRSALLLYCKRQLDASSTSFLTRQFRKSFYYLKIMMIVLPHLPKIIVARKISKQKAAFIYD